MTKPANNGPLHHGPFYIADPTGAGRGHLYPFVCFACRGCFKRPVALDAFARKCHRCGATAAPFWTKFKPPRRDDEGQWEKVEALARSGFFFLSVGEPYPDSLKEVRSFAERHRSVQSSWRERWPDYYRDLDAALSRAPHQS